MLKKYSYRLRTKLGRPGAVKDLAAYRRAAKDLAVLGLRAESNHMQCLVYLLRIGCPCYFFFLKI